MNITNPEQCIEEWEKDFIRTGNNTYIPSEDKDRVLHELDQLYNELYVVLLLLGKKPDIQMSI